MTQIYFFVYLCLPFNYEAKDRIFRFKSLKGRLAQLVQSIWFTPRGSGVRISQRPQPFPGNRASNIQGGIKACFG